MSPVNPYLKQYQKNQVETASPEQILILLYNGAINFLNRAKINLEENDDDKYHYNMLKCKNIIAEFMDTLDMENGGEFAAVLYRLYKYLRKIVVTANVTKDVNGINEVLKHLTELRNTWLQAIEISKKERTQDANGQDFVSRSTEEYEDFYYDEEGKIEKKAEDEELEESLQNEEV